MKHGKTDVERQISIQGILSSVFGIMFGKENEALINGLHVATIISSYVKMGAVRDTMQTPWSDSAFICDSLIRLDPVFSGVKLICHMLISFGVRRCISAPD